MVDLMRYLPPYYDDVVEMNLVMEAENPEVDELSVALTQVKDNQFILTADNSRVRQWEKLLKLHPDMAAQSLDYRKAMVIMRLSTRSPLTNRWLVEKLNEVVGVGRYIIELEHDKYWLYIRLHKDALEIMTDLKTYLREKLPANLGISLRDLTKTWGDVLNKYYFTWGPTSAMNTWGILRSLTWSDLRELTWAQAVNLRVAGRGVRGGRLWWEDGDAGDPAVVNTWQDIKEYKLEG